MNRRAVLASSGVTLGAVLAGCLDEADPGASADDDDDPDSACETAAAIVDALVDEEYGRAASFAPTEHGTDGPDDPASFDEQLASIAAVYEDMGTPDDVLERSCSVVEAGEDRQEFDAFVDDVIDDDVAVGDGGYLEYELEIAVGDATAGVDLTGFAVELDGSWYGALEGSLVPAPGADVTVEGDGSSSVEVRATSIDPDTQVFVQGDGIDEPTNYPVTEDDPLELTSDDVDPGQYAVVAVLEGDPDAAPEAIVDTFRIDDPGAGDWADVEEIVLDGQTPGWIGIEPPVVEGEENPTLLLSAGEAYAISWEEGDGMPHNIELRDENDEVVDGYRTEIVDHPGPDQVIEFTATPELAYYVCEPHEAAMRGDIVVEE